MLVDPLGSKYPTPESLQQFYDQVEAEIAAVPGVASVGWASSLPLDLSDGFPYVVAQSESHNWPGYSGRVKEALPSRGEKILSIATDRIVALIQRWSADPGAPGVW